MHATHNKTRPLPLLLYFSIMVNRISDNLDNTSIFPESFEILNKSKDKVETKEHAFCEKYIFLNWGEENICIQRIDQGQVDIWLDSWSLVVEQINVSVRQLGRQYLLEQQYGGDYKTGSCVYHIFVIWFEF